MREGGTSERASACLKISKSHIVYRQMTAKFCLHFIFPFSPSEACGVGCPRGQKTGGRAAGGHP
jgi:hypothetical protein